MKVEIELHKNDLIFICLISLLACLTVSYFIYRETAIRQALIEQAKPQNYGAGILESIDRYSKEGGKKR